MNFGKSKQHLEEWTGAQASRLLFAAESQNASETLALQSENAKRARLPNQSAPRPLKDNSTYYFFAGEAVAAGLAAGVAAGVGVGLGAAFDGS